MKRVLWVLFPLLVFVSASQPLFAGEAWVVGGVYTGRVVYCRDAQDANEIAAAYVGGGEQAADAVLETKRAPRIESGKCAAQAAQFIVVRLVSVHKRGDEAMNVVEVLDFAGSGTYYVVNSARVVAGEQKRGSSV